MTDKQRSAAQNWEPLINHANHVRRVLVDNGKTAYLNLNLDHLLSAHERGSRTQRLKEDIAKAIDEALEEFNWLFFQEEAKGNV